MHRRSEILKNSRSTKTIHPDIFFSFQHQKMLTPQFSVDQDDNNVYIDIKAPYIKAADVEFNVTGELFIFSLHPYYLRLRFPGLLKEDREDEDDESKLSHANYDMATSTVKVRIPKETPGEFFKDLDMITKLLARKDDDISGNSNQNSTKPLIQEMDNSDNIESIAAHGENFDWEVEQTLPSDTSSSVLGVKYGFDDQYSGEIGVSIMNGNMINTLPDPEKTPSESRKQIRQELEDEKFDPEYYLADFMDNPEINELIQWKFDIRDFLEYSTHDKDQLTRLPKKSYHLISNPKITYVGLVSIVFGYLFDYRTTMADHTVESAWTIGTLIPAVSCLDNYFTTLHSLVETCTRRALCYPLYRHWGLAMKVWDDVYELLKKASSDKKIIVKVLLNVISIFDSADTAHSVYNRILFQDYAAWIQQANDTVVRSLAHELKKFTQDLQKNDIGWPLKELEQAALETSLDEDE